MPRLRTHPDEILAEEYLEPLGLSASALAQAIGSLETGSATSSGDGGVCRRKWPSPGRYFDVDPRFWMNLQAAHDLSRAEAEQDDSAVRPRTEIAA